jgi:DNA polymerase III epsilon subunit-like protein
MSVLFLDFESYYNRKEKYDLKNISMLEYCRDPRFQPHGFGYAWWEWPEQQKARWVSGKEARRFFSDISEREWKEIAVCGHNVKFDGFILRNHYGASPGRWIDTKAMSKAVLGKTVKGHSLADLAEHFGYQPKGFMTCEGIRNLTPELEEQLATYCCHDVELTMGVYEKLVLDFPKNQEAMMDWTVRTFVEPKMILDVPLLEQTSVAEAERKRAAFAALNIEKKIFSSNDKFSKLLRERGFEVPLKNSPKKKNVDGTPMQIPALALHDIDFLEMLESDDEELRTLCEARVAAKSNLLETRSGKMANIGKSGRWAFDIEFSGADQTHRLSGGKGAGGNPQNFTRGSTLRKAVQPPVGDCLVVGDFSNIELRIVAYLSGDPGLISGIESGRDLYCDYGSVFYEREITKADEDERFFSKIAVLGLGYGMGWNKFKHTVRVQAKKDIDEETATRAVGIYRKRYPGVSQLWSFLDNKIALMLTEGEKPLGSLPVVMEKESIVLPSGLKLRYPNLRQERGEKNRMEWVYDIYDKRKFVTRKLYGGKLLENISQALAGEICKEAAMRFLPYVTGLVHDEIHMVVRRHLGPIMTKKLEIAMSQAPRWLPQIKLNAEVGYGSDWLSAKK